MAQMNTKPGTNQLAQPPSSSSTLASPGLPAFFEGLTGVAFFADGASRGAAPRVVALSHGDVVRRTGPTQRVLPAGAKAFEGHDCDGAVMAQAAAKATGQIGHQGNLLGELSMPLGSCRLGFLKRLRKESVPSISRS
eukprot:CAMPEP_0170631252 /NCGR_PEP_ID=MMETSP0224-20130122/34515_1 /TAXON_ID=285029 /ORGANISM="Togula jolla, Strain CCCM 725" /LENGTH=136 /DNA_ID=CAMNT_0010959525 /DNA_START=173 /DNA_END=580 /DNA_ORIENTATION=+